MGFTIVEERQPSFLLDGAVLITGEVDRTTEFETGFQGHEALRDGEWRADPLILDDQALIVSLGDRGLVILSGCGHAGIVNTVRFARKLTSSNSSARPRTCASRLKAFNNRHTTSTFFCECRNCPESSSQD